jgi:hypothetical protein
MQVLPSKGICPESIRRDVVRSPTALERDDNDVDVDVVSLLHFLVLHATRGLVMTDSTFPKATTETATHRSDLPPRDCSEAPA